MSLKSLQQQVPIVKQNMLRLLSQYSEDLANFIWDKQLFEYLQELAPNGKALRGALLLEWAQQLSVEVDTSALLDIAAAIEIIHLGLLIQDDIADGDAQRRGSLTFHTFWHQKITNNWPNQYQNASKLAESTAYLVGDVTFFMGSQIILNADITADQKIAVLKVANQELMSLGLAQIEDIRLAALLDGLEITQHQISQMLAAKSGHYTIRWPLAIALALGEGLSSLKSQHLLKIAELLGILFQISDDKIGLFGDPATTGKAAGNDLLERKKTLYWQAFYELASSEQIRELESILNAKMLKSDGLSKKQLMQAQQLFEKVGAVKKVEKFANALIADAQEKIQSAQLTASQQHFWQDLLAFLVTRNK